MLSLSCSSTYATTRPFTTGFPRMNIEMMFVSIKAGSMDSPPGSSSAPSFFGLSEK